MNPSKISTFEELKQQWKKNRDALRKPDGIDQNALDQIIRQRAKKQKRIAMQYFWAAFALQLIVYGMVSHVIVRYGNDRETLMYAVAGALLFLPYTVVMMRKFKQMAVNRPTGAADANSNGLLQYVSRQYALLNSFYRFKRVYEIILIPLSTGIGTVLVFQLCVPGGAAAHLTGVIITFVLALLSCVLAIATENRRHFREPLARLREILAEFGDETKGNNQ